MTPLAIQHFKKILAIGAHADDLEIGCYATLQQLADNGAEIHFVVLSGSAERQQEQALSIKTWGLPIRFQHFAFTDGLLPQQVPEIKQAIREFVNGHTYDLILVHNREDQHQDHLTLGHLAYNLFRETIIWEYEIPKYDIDTPQPNLYISLTKEQIEAKVRHLEHNFASQATKAWYTGETFLSLARLRGIQCNAAYAEAFICRKLSILL